VENQLTIFPGIGKSRGDPLKNTNVGFSAVLPTVQAALVACNQSICGGFPAEKCGKRQYIGQNSCFVFTKLYFWCILQMDQSV